MCSLRLAVLAVLAIAGATRSGHASPNVDLDDPRYQELEHLRALGKLPAFSGGTRPLTEARMDALFAAAEPAEPRARLPSGLWARPLQRLQLTAADWSVADRPYSTAARPRDIAGGIDISCEHLQGRHCGDGAGTVLDLEGSAGYRAWVSGSLRVQAAAGSWDDHADLRVARGYVQAELGPVLIEAGRDVLQLGPASRTQLGWGDHAAPLDQVRLSTSRPLPLAGIDGHTLRGSVLYVVGRLRSPQTFSGSLLSIARAQVDVRDQVEIGMMQLLQLGGDGAPALGAWDFILEHVRRGNLNAAEGDTSNRRIGFDVATRIAALANARIYYQVVFEDWRKRFHDAVRFDADHLIGFELAARQDRGLLVELSTTGVRSQEHIPRLTGFTNAGLVGGSPLGPDATSLYVRGHLALGPASVWPWIELGWLSSDTYTFVAHGPISLATRGPREDRYRIGLPVIMQWAHGLRGTIEATYERVVTAEFVPGRTANNAGVSLSVVWDLGDRALLR